MFDLSAALDQRAGCWVKRQHVRRKRSCPFWSKTHRVHILRTSDDTHLRLRPAQRWE